MEIEFENRASVEWVILADFAEVVGGKLYLMGGGWDTVVSQSPLPMTRNFGVAVAVRIPWNDTNQRHQIDIEIQDEDGQGLAKIGGHFEVGRPPGIPQGQSQRFQLAMNVSSRFQKAGTYTVVARINETPDAHTTFRVAAPG